MFKPNNQKPIVPKNETNASDNHYSFRTFKEDARKKMTTNYGVQKTNKIEPTNIMKQRNENRFQTNQMITERIQQSDIKAKENKDMQPMTDNEMKRFIRYPKKPQMMDINRPKDSFEQRKVIVPKREMGPGTSSLGSSANSPVVSSGSSSGPSLKAHRHPVPSHSLLQSSSTATTSIVEKSAPTATFSASIEDRALLTYLLQMRYMTMDQVDRKFLGNQQSAQSFRNLLAGGYIKCKDGSPNPESLLVPTDKAYELLKIENPGKEVPKPIKRVFEPELNHDLKLVEIRMKFEQLNFIEKWFSESMLEDVPMMKELFTDLPDAVCKKKNEKGYFLELEISQKSFKRYEERILLYQEVLEKKEIKESGIEGVIFLCTDPKVFGIIKERLPKSKNFSVLMLSRYLKEKAA